MDCMRKQFVEGVLLNGRYETISPLNNGSFGMVFRARDVVTGEEVALKCLTKQSAVNVCPSFLAVDDRSEELTIHRRIGHHPNIVNLLGTFETENHSYLVQEYCTNGDLYEAIRLGKGPLETEHVREFMFQLVDAVETMHAQGIFHRDIKPENILLTQNGSMKLGDFGLATTDDVSYEIAVGSDRYMAPEQLEPSSSGYAPAQADIWAIGICLLNILFARNPFATPSTSDPLFADFAGDRQSLFDVFPNMSQDTFEVLRHCLALDPANRSLAAVREALDRVVTFTTDDESLDEFCLESHDRVAATANREPLRTPSISTPQIDPNGAFPWAKALALSPPQHVRQLSAIPDIESHADPSLPPDDQGWFSVPPVKQEASSIASFVDSGLGLSVGSDPVESRSLRSNQSRPVPIAASVSASVVRPSRSMSFIFGKKQDAVAKSWSDLWDEEEEMLHGTSIPHETVFGGFKQRLLHEERAQASSGDTTPRAGLSEVKNPAHVNNSRRRPVGTVAPTRKVDERVSEHTGFLFEDHHVTPTPSNAKYSPPSKRSLMEKWAALGDRRRARPAPEKSTTSSSQVHGGHNHNPSSWTNYARKRSRAGSWRRNMGTLLNQNEHDNVESGGPWGKKDWNTSKDWRAHGNVFLHGRGRQPRQQQVSCSVAANDLSDIGDFEWVGGWHDLHL